MSEVKAPESDTIWFCRECGEAGTYSNKHELWHKVFCVERDNATVQVEYVPATDSPDREPDAWQCDCGRVVESRMKWASHAHYGGSEGNDPAPINWTPLYRNPPDRSDGLREALEELVRLSEHYWHPAMRPKRLDEALAAARLALKAESK